MIAYIKGKLVEKTPTYVVLESGNMGYQIFISLQTYNVIQNQNEAQLFTRMTAKIENQNVTGYLLYGFHETKEKELFEKLISVSGVGSNTAIVMLSTYKTSEIINAILSGDVAMIKSIKGIGPKSAQRIILELKDKLDPASQFESHSGVTHNTLKDEALLALLSLGFNRNTVVKTINKVMMSDASIDSVEELIKQSLKLL